ncbi:MAG: phosphotransferase [Candidatus Riflebacteria bacterium]|nr:phosphotransferase [Candidatus Riflebacteria bacterium]
MHLGLQRRVGAGMTAGPRRDPSRELDLPALRLALESWLSGRHGVRLSIDRLQVHPVPQQSSFALREVVAETSGGETVRLILKELGSGAMLPDARRAKPPFVHDPRREEVVYGEFLPDGPSGTAHCYGIFVDETSNRRWLCLERVLGVELYQVGDFSAWQDAARWLAVLHARFARDRTAWADRSDSLLRHDEPYLRLWLKRARTFLKTAELAPETRGALKRLARVHDVVVSRLLSLPATLIHGDCYASNVLVADLERGRRICPVDWEMAGLGPGLLDLAALVSGRWSEEQRTALAAAYHAEACRPGPGSLTFAETLEALDCCRLQVALQHLGWSADWTPPASQLHDWLGEALALSERLGAPAH